MKEVISRALAASPFLSECHLDPSALTVRSYKTGKFVSDHPYGVPSMGLLLSGRIDVYSVSIDGRDILLNSLTTGESFGFSNLLFHDDSEAETILCCAQETEVLYIPKQYILQEMEQNAALAMRYASICNDKIQFLLKRIELLTMQPCRGRVIAYLLSQADENGHIRLQSSKEGMARLLGISRAALFRELAALQGMEALEIEGRSMTILDKGTLERLLYQSPTPR